jgi:hypothetical protein
MKRDVDIVAMHRIIPPDVFKLFELDRFDRYVLQKSEIALRANIFA